MALSFNPLITGALNVSRGIPASMKSNLFNAPYIRLYPSSVAMPTTVPNGPSSLPAGFIAQFSTLGTSMSGSGVITTTGVNATSTTTGAGTIAWASISSSSSGSDSDLIITDSVVANGGNGIIAVSPGLTLSSGQSVTIILSFKAIIL